VKKFISFLAVLVILFHISMFIPFISKAQGAPAFSISEKEVVFLLDASKSMGGRADSAVTDAVRQILYSLPSGIRAGLVVYNTDIQGVAEIGSGVNTGAFPFPGRQWD